jgi:lipopolysaccharide transport protein LptA
MKISSAFLIIFTISVFLTFPDPVRTETAPEGGEASGTSGQIIIHHSDTFVADYSKGTAVFSGRVEAEWDNITLSCKRLEVSYENSAGKKDTEDLQARIKGMTATGDVVINRQADGITAMAEKVEYLKADETMIMTGNPVLKRGSDQMKASKITYEIKANKFSFENVEAVLIPGEKR